MIDGEPVVVCWQPRDFEVVLAAAADMGLPVAVSSSAGRLHLDDQGSGGGQGLRPFDPE